MLSIINFDFLYIFCLIIIIICFFKKINIYLNIFKVSLRGEDSFVSFVSYEELNSPLSVTMENEVKVAFEVRKKERRREDLNNLILVT